MDLRNLNTQKLAQNGFLFETPEEAKLFVEVIREELETRVGAAISEGTDGERLLEFDLCQTPEEETAWLECIVTAVKKQQKGCHRKKRWREGFYVKSVSTKPRIFQRD